jgi:DUF4097 and DUF4098 domain-containing protein YvlB
MQTRVVFLAVFFLCAALVFPLEETKTLSLSAEGIEVVEIDCGAGFLEVKGVEGQNEIEVSAQIVLKGRSEEKAQEFIQKNVKLKLAKKGNRAILISKIRQKFSLFSWKTAVINLTVHVPQKIALDIDDGSGWLEVENIVGQVDVDDGSGEMRVMNVNGDVDIDDGSGEIEIKGVTGDVKIDDGSGEIGVEDVTGDVSVDDGSGTVHIRIVGGSVTVNDGSGSIYVDEVEGDFILKDDGTGSVKVKNIKGRTIK